MNVEAIYCQLTKNHKLLLPELKYVKRVNLANRKREFEERTYRASLSNSLSDDENASCDELSPFEFKYDKVNTELSRGKSSTKDTQNDLAVSSDFWIKD